MENDEQYQSWVKFLQRFSVTKKVEGLFKYT